ncbi:MAG: hypothetical protein AB1611_09245 [bacterium]
MSEEKKQPEYYEQDVNTRFNSLERIVDRMERSFEKTVDGIKSEVKEIRSEVKEIRSEVKEIRSEVDEIKKDNKATRRWVAGTVIGTGFVVLFGIAAVLLTFAQIQTSWMQQVISFALKAIK